MRPTEPASRIVSALRTTWATLWLFVIPKDLWSLLVVWPTVFLSVVSYLWEPSGLGVRLILLTVVWDVTMGFWLMVSAMKASRDALAATVVGLQDCTYTRIGWDHILSGDDASMIDQASLISFMARQGLPYDHLKDVRFFRVDMGESGVIPGGLGVFNVPFIEGVVLVRDDPRDAGVEERFCLYHELGHTLGSEFVVQSALRKGVTLPFVALLLAATAAHVTRTTLLVFAMCLVALSLVRSVLARRRKTQRAIFEMKADQFAIGFLDEEERRYLLPKIESVLPQDRDLSPLEHLTRVGAARTLLETGVSPAQTDWSISNGAFFFETQLPALNLGAWMILLASFIGAPAAGLVYGFQWLIVAAVVVGILRYALYYWKGIVLELIFVRRVTWQDGKFRLRTGPPVPESALTM
ncbi:M48 family metalloprotease [Longimicrobium sp.]|uniref:M48 family metalloprotease n=1 Tax=Longimicrobium sp. TaxID=2029185 RepID=UPI003B3A62F3